MDYFDDAFGGFSPQTDSDAALKLSLDALVADDRVEELTALVATDSLGGIEGEPGWIIERRFGEGIVGYESWPKYAAFHAHVDPESFSLTFPDFFCDEKTFYRYVKSIIGVYVARDPKRAAGIKVLADHLR